MKKVKIYSTPTCPYCLMAKEFMEEHNIDFEDIDVSRDLEAAREMVEKSGQTGVPVIEIDGEIIVGFDEERIRNALDLKDD